MPGTWRRGGWSPESVRRIPLKRASKPSGRPAVSLPLPRPYRLLVLGVAAVVIGLGVSYRLYDPDLWQHLRVGRTLWEGHAIPRTNVWTWPTFGEPYLLPSWLFRALLWPFYALAGEWGLMAWRWGFTLATFALAGLAARRMGARGVTVVVAIAWCALLYRSRSMVRPETLACLLLALQVWILETRRRGGPDRSAWIVPITWVWANAHVSYYLPLALTGFHVLAEGLAAGRGRPGARPPARLALVLAASAAACFVNPFGWRALWQPFQYLLEWRHQPLFGMILELKPITWEAHRRDGLLVWMLLAWGLWLARLVRRRGDLVDTLVYAAFFASALGAQRFLGFLCVAAAPIFARDLAWGVQSLRLPPALRSAPARAAGASLLIALGAVPQLLQEPWRPGFGLDWRAFPVRACDWIEKHGVRGRSFGAFHFAGYQLWRFWPQRDRLPFMDIHVTGSRADQDLYALSWEREPVWRALEAKYSFDYLLLPRTQFPRQDLLDRLDADSTWALVFLDDVAALWLRRSGRFSDLAARERYSILPAGDRALPERMHAAHFDPEARRALRAELERQLRESEWNWRARSTLATLEILERRWPEALAQLEQTRRLNPEAPLLAERFRMLRDSLPPGR